MQHPAPPSEADRGIAVGRPDTGVCASAFRKLCAIAMAIGYTNAGTVEFLMDETASSISSRSTRAFRWSIRSPRWSRASIWSKRRSASRRASVLPRFWPRPNRTARPCHRVPHQCRASRNLRALARPHHRHESARRHGRARGYGRVSGRRDSALLRFAGREADRLGRDRAEAIARMRTRAQTCSSWKESTLPSRCTRKFCAHPDFIAGKIDTGFLTRSGLLPEKK